MNADNLAVHAGLRKSRRAISSYAAGPGLMNQAHGLFSHKGQLSSAARFSVREPWLPPVISTVDPFARGLDGHLEKLLPNGHSGDFGRALRGTTCCFWKADQRAATNRASADA